MKILSAASLGFNFTVFYKKEYISRTLKHAQYVLRWSVPDFV